MIRKYGLVQVLRTQARQEEGRFKYHVLRLGREGRAREKLCVKMGRTPRKGTGKGRGSRGGSSDNFSPKIREFLKKV